MEKINIPVKDDGNETSVLYDKFNECFQIKRKQNHSIREIGVKISIMSFESISLYHIIIIIMIFLNTQNGFNRKINFFAFFSLLNKQISNIILVLHSTYSYYYVCFDTSSVCWLLSILHIVHFHVLSFHLFFLIAEVHMIINVEHKCTKWALICIVDTS